MSGAANLKSNTDHVRRAAGHGERGGKTKTALQKRGQSQLFAPRLEKAREMLICLHGEKPCVTSKTQPSSPFILPLRPHGDQGDMMFFTSFLVITQHDPLCSGRPDKVILWVGVSQGEGQTVWLFDYISLLLIELNKGKIFMFFS